MRLALDQAKRTLGNTKKNPAVGCVIVKNQHVISAGYTSIYGRPHAEQNAIADCAKRGVSCNGSTVYITHYPCIICTRILLAAGISEIKYLENYKNDELVKTFTDQAKVSIINIKTNN